MNKKVSVIIPVYNAEKYLDRSIKSVLNQSYDNLEIIIVDDSSTDNSKDIIKKYASKDSRIMPIYSEVNQGVSKARNIGLNIFSGDYLIFMDADDYITKDAIKILMEKCNKYDADIVDSYHLVISNNKTFLEAKPLKEDLVMGDKSNIDMLTKATYITGKLIDRKLVKDLLFDVNLRRYEDLVFEHQLKLRLKNYVLIKNVIYYYYQVPTSLVNSLGSKHTAYMDAAKEVMDIYKDESDEAKELMESLLFTNGFLTGITKVVKNDKSIDENVNILKEYLLTFKDVFKTYESNKKISKFIRNQYNKMINSDKKIKRFIKLTKNIDFISLYFKYLSIANKYNI